MFEQHFFSSKDDIQCNGVNDSTKADESVPSIPFECVEQKLLSEGEICLKSGHNSIKLSARVSRCICRNNYTYKEYIKLSMLQRTRNSGGSSGARVSILGKKNIFLTSQKYFSDWQKDFSEV